MTAKNEMIEKLCRIAELLEQNEGIEACELWKNDRLAFSFFLEDGAQALFDKFPDHDSKEGSAAFGLQAMADNFEFAFDVFENNKEQCAEYLTKKARQSKFHESLLEFSKVVL